MAGRKPKFNKRKCLKCKFHGNCGAGVGVKINGASRGVICDYAGVTGNTCLTLDSSRHVIDIRGNDYDHCALYTKGERKRDTNAYGGGAY